MTWSYNAGTSTPGFGGLAEFTSLRINDGTFVPLDIPPLRQTAPLRVPKAPVPRGGGATSDPLLDVWEFEILARLDAVAGADVQAATDYLFSKVNVAKGSMTLTLNAKGWSAAQTMTVRVNGQVSVDEMEIEQKKLEIRVVTIPLIAADPRRYGAAVTTAITTGTSVTNAGTTPAPFDAIFVGPLTSPEINGPGSGNKIKLTSVASGQTITVTTVDPETGTTTLSDNLGTDPQVLFALMETDTADYIQPGTESWSKTATGAGSVSIRVKPAYA